MEEVEDKATDISRWKHEIQCYEKEVEVWQERGKKILRRYKDERGTRTEHAHRYNILWSNVQTLAPAVYNSPPKPNIERRFKDDDDVGRVASDVLERSCSYFIDTELFDSVMRQAVQDRLLPGRGTAWVRYCPKFVQSVEITDDEEELTEELDYEEVMVDYVHWQDFGHTVARTWEEVTAVWRKAYLGREELIERFGEDLGKRIPLDYEPRKLNDSAMEEVANKATIYELWDKSEKQAIWLHKDLPGALDIRDDPLKLKEFFPCPKPIYATLTNDSLVPIPDYTEYQDQAAELDELTNRIQSITKCIKVAGLFDASAEGVQRLLNEGVQNTLIQVEQWAIFGEKGGLKGAMELLPMQEIAQTLMVLYEAREKVKADLYEITGLSDILRGASEANETATAQKIKGQYASMRLNAMQKDVSRFARDLTAIIAEIIAEQFEIETIKQISGVHLLTAAEKQQLAMQYAPKPPIPGQPPAPPPQIPDDVEELLSAPTWEEIDGLIKNQQIRCYRIDIETDSTIKADQQAEQQARVEFLTAAGGFIREAVQVQNPQLQPLLMEMLMFGVRGFKAGRELEGMFKEAMVKLKKEAANPAPQPNPEMIKMQAEMKQHEMEMQQAQLEHQQEMQQRQQEQEMQAMIEQHRNELEAQRETMRIQQEHQSAQLKAENDMAMAKYKADLDAQNAEKLALLNYQLDTQKLDAQVAMKQAETGYIDPKPIIDGILAQLGDLRNEVQQAKEMHTRPKIITLDNGRTAKVEVAQ